MPAYVMFGFDTAGSLAEETNDPRRRAPRAILGALGAAGVAGMLLLLFALMAAPDLPAEGLSSNGLPYLVKQVLGETAGNILLCRTSCSRSASAAWRSRLPPSA